MPARRKRANLGRCTKKSAGMQNIRAHRRDEQIQQDNADVRVSMVHFRESQTQEARDERNRQRRLEQARRYVVNTRRAINQQRQQVHRAFTSDSFLRLAFQYEPDVKYYAHSKVDIGTMDKECPHCHAPKFKNEPAGLCCASGKVQLPEIEAPPEPLHGLLIVLSDSHAIVINPDKTPAGEHIRRFNAPVVDNVAGIMVGDRTASRQIVIRRRDNNLHLGGMR
ncbi:ATP-dependent DNA helicase [Caerostris extrusa]|uniref:ATP-dependent DNA helicase n=1 Tax=Caerostris extrusa TaxID=172846 RepID=A0AAV4Y258_CAEEX|nr:ATP-dependent DNA helicase [Caerostris extrusa]